MTSGLLLNYCIIVVLLSISFVSTMKCYSSHQIRELSEDLTFPNNVTATKLTSYDGDPRCLVYVGFNNTHHEALQIVKGSLAIPMECASSSEHCFKVPPHPEYLFVSLPGMACCCNWDLCNDSDDLISAFDPIAANFRGTFEKQPSDNVDSSEILSDTQADSALIHLMKAEKNIKANKSNSSDNIDDKTMNTDRTECPKIENKLFTPDTSRRIMEQTAIDNTEEIVSMKGSYNLQRMLLRRPVAQRLANGRIQGVSMNYDNSTYSDLE
uniref:Activin_recp domain-containing protein n=1 Tax=Heterorhabditis bacteriophora TaxID=37862 RepID=A0A1I7X4K5_HETBA